MDIENNSPLLPDSVENSNLVYDSLTTRNLTLTHCLIAFIMYFFMIVICCLIIFVPYAIYRLIS